MNAVLAIEISCNSHRFTFQNESEAARAMVKRKYSVVDGDDDGDETYAHQEDSEEEEGSDDGEDDLTYEERELFDNEDEEGADEVKEGVTTKPAPERKRVTMPEPDVVIFPNFGDAFEYLQAYFDRTWQPFRYVTYPSECVLFLVCNLWLVFGARWPSKSSRRRIAQGPKMSLTTVNAVRLVNRITLASSCALMGFHGVNVVS